MTTKTAVSTPTVVAPNSQAGITSNVVRPRRNPVSIVAGGLLVVVLALAFMWIQLRSDQTVAVLMVARPVPAGQVITSPDLRVTTVVPEASVRLVPSSQADTVVGRTAAVPLVVGALLSPAQVGPAAWPAAGEAVVALPLKPGRIPAGIAPGARVRMLTVATTDSPAIGGQAGVVGTVVEVSREVDASGTVVVSVLLKVADAGVAAASGDATLILLGPAG